MRILITALIFFLFFGCRRSTVISNDLISASSTTNMGGKKVKDVSIGEHQFYRLDSATEYGPAYTYNLKQEDYNKPICLIITGKARTNFVNSNGAITYALHDSTKQLNWDASRIKYHIIDLNVWSRFEEKIYYRASTNGFRYNKIVVQPFLPHAGKEVFDMDSIRIKIVALPNI
ncbi:MAG: hypothetical protein HYX39_13180 [Bacteroidetes bacterium]|nr:hypothetical protein [Bacteroidota bacterium]